MRSSRSKSDKSDRGGQRSADTEPPLRERVAAIGRDLRSRGANAATALVAVRARWRLPRSARIGGMVAAGVLAGGVLWLAGLMVYYTVVMPNPRAMQQGQRAPVIRVLAQDGQVLAERGAAHDFMPLALLPDHVVAAVLATEDRRFFSHWGIDPRGLVRAMFANLRAGRYAQGGSTLTQQLAKNLFLSSERTLSRKIDEVALALWLELRLAKHDILELYLNRVYFGGGAYGIEAAAQRYFAKSARELTIAEAALVAGLLKAPSRYSPVSNPALAKARGRVVLKAMLAAGAISAAQERRALLQPMRFALERRDRERDDAGTGYLVDLVMDRMPQILGAGRGEVVVETTVDLALQRKLQSVVRGALDQKGAALDAGQAAAVMLDMDGGIRALVGGRSYAESQFNRAVKAKRQPGSAFKPIVYLAALERGFLPQTRVLDLPLNIEGWAPRNDGGRHRGSVSVEEALARSINTVAVRLLMDVGSRRVVEAARRLGIRAELAETPALALGVSEMPLVELTGAYTVLANGGFSVAPHIIKRIRLSSGRIVHVRDVPRLKQVVAGETVAALNGMLRGVMTTGTGRRAAFGGHPAAGKTGTTQDFRDAWFVGYTGHLVTGVWVGNDSGRPMNRVGGSSLPADIWREAMQFAHVGRPALDLPGSRNAVTDGPETAAGVAAKSGGHADSRETLSLSIPPLPAQRPVPRIAQRAAQGPAAQQVSGLVHLPSSAVGQVSQAAATKPASDTVAPPPLPVPARAPGSRAPAPIESDFIARALAGLPAPPSGEQAREAAREAPVRRSDSGSGSRISGRWWLPRAMGLGVTRETASQAMPDL